MAPFYKLDTDTYTHSAIMNIPSAVTTERFIDNDTHPTPDDGRDTTVSNFPVSMECVERGSGRYIVIYDKGCMIHLESKLTVKVFF